MLISAMTTHIVRVVVKAGDGKVEEQLGKVVATAWGSACEYGAFSCVPVVTPITIYSIPWSLLDNAYVFLRVPTIV